MARAILALSFVFSLGCTGAIGNGTGPDGNGPPPPGRVDPNQNVNRSGLPNSLTPEYPVNQLSLPPAPSTCTGEATGYLPKGAAQLNALCSRGYTDPISTAFCKSNPPNLTSVDDVLSAVGLAFAPPPYTVATNGAAGNPGYILQAQSTSISTRRVSQLNPRAIIFTPPLARGRMTGTPKPNASFVAVGITRGEQQIELLAKDPVVGIRFFLLKFEQACNSAPGGCTPADLYTPAAESGFTSWSLYDDQDLKNTTLDCLQCHQPAGPGTPRMMRMQELQHPWQHWMYNDSLNVATLRADFHAAHGTTEKYGGVPGAAIDMGDAPKMEAFVENNGFINQPNEYQSLTIANEMADAGTSATWASLYQSSESGKDIPVPYYDVKATDPVKVQALIAQYTGVINGTLPASALTDLKDVFSDVAERAMSHKPAVGLSGTQILAQACQQCHNSHLDQSLTRARFNVENLGAMSQAEKDEAARRVALPADDCSHMPPQRFRDLDPSEIALVQAALQ